jgi:hypothetical protein
MTMHLEKAYITTTRYNGKQKKSKSKRLAKAQEEHEAWLESMGVGKAKNMLYNKWGKRVGLNEIPDYREHQATAALSNRVAANGAAKERKIYTGDEIVGIATMHKSNAVPIRRDNKDAAKEVAAMRR